MIKSFFSQQKQSIDRLPKMCFYLFFNNIIILIMSHLTSKFKSTPTFTFKFRNQTVTKYNKPEHLPSPNQYQLDQGSISGKQQGVKFSKDKKGMILPLTKANPGPGTYEHESSVNLGSFNKTQILKKGENRFRVTQQVTPSSVHYLVKDIPRRSVPEYSIGKNSRSLRQLSGISTSPAPNNYQPSLKSQQNSVSIAIGSSKRKPNMHPQNNPGPGQFSIQKQIFGSSFNQKKQLFSKAKRSTSFTLQSQTPGPALYQKQSSFSMNLRKKRGFSLCSRSEAKLLMTPGPGLYQNKSQVYKFKRGSIPTLPKTQRKLFHNEFKRATSVPGPGHNQTSYVEYSKFNSSNASKFSKAKLRRCLQAPQNKTAFINPEKIDVNKTFTPRFSIPASKRRDIFQQQVKKAVPVSAYNPNEKIIKPSQISYKMSKSERLKQEKTVEVGPGYYNPEKSADFSTKKSKFMKEKRRTFLDQVINSKLSTFKDQTFQNRQQFPNPPKYMNVHKKLEINESKMKKF